MKVYESANIKNIALVGHAGCGKTTLTESMLFESGKISRMGRVEDSNTVSDHHNVEHERGNSIFASLMHAEWRENKINLIDTPGFDDFAGEMIAGLKVADTAVVVLNAQQGVEVGTEQVWEYVQQYELPAIIAVNQVDGEKADFDRTVEQARKRFGKATLIQYPLNQGPSFNAIIDVLKMTMYEFPAAGGKPEKKAIPGPEKARADALHNELVETVAGNDEKLMEKYFEKGSLDEEELIAGLKHSFIRREIYPVFCLSARKNMGSGRLMGFINNVAPAAIERPEARLVGGKTLPCNPAGPAVLFVFKTTSEPNLGNMSFFKVCSGKVSQGMDLVNSKTSGSERINQLFLMEGKNRVTVEALNAGDLGATVKLRETSTNTTLHPKGKELVIEPIRFPEPIIRTALVTKNKGDDEKLSAALHHIRDEDPTIILEHSQELKQLLLNGQGEMHLAIVKWKLENIYGLKVDQVEPKIPYRETIHRQARAVYRHKKQSGGAGQFAEVHILMEPWHEGMPDPPDFNVRSREEIELKWGGKLVFFNCIVGGAIDQKFMNAILKGIMEKMEQGPLTDCYVRDIRISVYDGKMHAVDSNDMAFKTAAMMAFKQAFLEADPKILEPIYNVEVIVPDEMMGDIMGDLQTRRSVILGMDTQGSNQVIKARVPLAELYKYSSALRSLSQGRAKYRRRFAEYQLVPPNIQQQVIATVKKELQEA